MNTMDTTWTLNNADRLLSKGGLTFRYSFLGKAGLPRGEMTPVAWEKQLPSGEFMRVTESELIRQLDSALGYRLAVLEDNRKNR